MTIPYRSIAALAICLAALLALSPSVYAHSGDTDSEGGHHDGESYHYHHGYPAHDHYDMDGDGVVDCPYDFDDKTGQSSGSSSVKPNLYFSHDGYPRHIHYDTDGDGDLDCPYGYGDDTTVPSSTVAENTSVETEEKTVPAWVYWIIGIMIVMLMWLNRSIRKQRKVADELEARHQEDLRQIKHNAEEIDALTSSLAQYKQKAAQANALNASIARYKKENELLLSKMMKYYRKNHILKSITYPHLNPTQQAEIESLMAGIDNGDVQIPDNIYFIEGGIPVMGSVRPDRPYGDLTVYCKDRGACFHTSKYCGNGIYKVTHAYFVIGKLPPCKRCAASHSNTIPEWYQRFNAVLSDDQI